ncbi:hypothetical protein [Paenibacillus sp. 1P03SA]|uniref:hypothetical protein n=1 Tax=Paenibacillus sp. 1P03SA TaxID=3132294 RepID=UPI0039A1D1B8
MTLGDTRKTLLLASILAVLGFIVFTANPGSKPSTTLYVFNPHADLTKEQLEQLNGARINIISYNPPLETFKITSFPTYILVKTETQELIGITNDFAELAKMRKTSK